MNQEIINLIDWAKIIALPIIIYVAYVNYKKCGEEYDKNKKYLYRQKTMITIAVLTALAIGYFFPAHNGGEDLWKELIFMFFMLIVFIATPTIAMLGNLLEMLRGEFEPADPGYMEILLGYITTMMAHSIMRLLYIT